MNIQFFNTRPSRSKALLTFLLGFSLIAAITSCTKDDDDLPQQPISALNVINLSPGSLTVNFFVDNQFISGPALSFNQQSGYLLYPPGKRKLDITTGGTSTVLATDSVALVLDEYATAYVIGQNQSPEILLVSDQISAPAAGKAKIRFLQFSPDAGSIDLRVKNAATLFSARNFRSVSDFVEIDPGTYVFELRSEANNVTKEINSVEIEAGRVYTIWAKGLLASSGDTGFSGSVLRGN